MRYKPIFERKYSNFVITIIELSRYYYLTIEHFSNNELLFDKQYFLTTNVEDMKADAYTIIDEYYNKPIIWD